MICEQNVNPGKRGTGGACVSMLSACRLSAVMYESFSAHLLHCFTLANTFVCMHSPCTVTTLANTAYVACPHTRY